MTKKEASFSLASLFYFHSKMPDEELQKDFCDSLLKNMVEHSVSGMRRPYDFLGRQKRMPRSTVSNSSCHDHYVEQSAAQHMSWMLTYGAKLICEETPERPQNPYKQYYQQYAAYLFADPAQASVFSFAKPKIVTVDEKVDLFGFLKPKTGTNRHLKEVAENVADFMRHDPFCEAIKNYKEAGCTENLQKRLDAFAQEVEPAVSAFWRGQGLESPKTAVLKVA